MPAAMPDNSLGAGKPSGASQTANSSMPTVV